MIQADTPNWNPLEKLLGGDLVRLGEWMWMFEQHDAGGRIQAYKHGDTRHYLFLGEHGEAYNPCGSDYAPVDPQEALRRATTF